MTELNIYPTRSSVRIKATYNNRIPSGCVSYAPFRHFVLLKKYILYGQGPIACSSSCSRGGRQKRYATSSHIYDVICDVKSADSRRVFLSYTFKKKEEPWKNDIVIIFDSDSGPLSGFTQIQYQCYSSSTWVNYGGW